MKKKPIKNKAEGFNIENLFICMRLTEVTKYPFAGYKAYQYARNSKSQIHLLDNDSIKIIEHPWAAFPKLKKETIIATPLSLTEAEITLLPLWFSNRIIQEEVAGIFNAGWYKDIKGLKKYWKEMAK